MSAYMRYIFETKSFDFANTDMFGDNINLGGFDKFIHKRDKNNSLKLEFEFDDCSEAILEYLKPNKIDLKYIKELKKFNKDDLIDIINNSDEYLHFNFARLKRVRESKRFKDGNEVRLTNQLCNKIYKEEFEHFASNLGRDITVVEERIDQTKKDHDDLVYYGSHLSTSIIEHKGLSYANNDRRELFNIDEFFNIYYQIHSFKDAKYYDKDYGSDLVYSFLDKNDQFKNEEIKKYFISNILIKKYINVEKYRLISEYKKSDFNQKYITLSSEDIEYIAQRAIDRIEMEYSIYQFRENLLNIKIPLKISLEIKYSLTLNKIFLKKVEYYIQNTLYDVVEQIELEHQDGVDLFTAAASFDDYGVYEYNNFGITDKLSNKGEFGIPPIFQNIPEIYNRHLLFNESEIMRYRDYDQLESRAKSEHSELESKYEAVFLSYKEGYNKLIGTFNDMLNFNKMQYIGPLRFYPERDETIKELDSNEEVMPDSKISWSLLKKDEKLRDTINKWLKDPVKLKTPYEIKYRKLYDIESSLYQLDFKKIMEVQTTVISNNEEIEESKLEYMTEDEIIDYIVELAKEEMEKTGLSSYECLPKIEKKIWYLKKFSQLDEQEQCIQVFKEMGVLDDMESKEELIFEDLRNNTKISNRDLGLGISQILPVLIATSRNKNMTIAIEQPELHLHPAVQCEIADEFIQSYKENKNEFLIETHSEHLLLRIMKRMRHAAEDREGRDKTLDLTPDDVCLLYIDADDESTYIKELRLSKKGKLLDHWPGGFFEEGYKERFQ